MHENLLKIAAQHGITEPQLMLMEMIRLHIPVHRNEMVAWMLRYPWTLGYCRGIDDTRKLPSKDDFEAAINELLQRNVLRMITASDVNGIPPEYSTRERYFPSSVGSLDWTPEGNLLAKRIFGDELVRPGN